MYAIVYKSDGFPVCQQVAGVSPDPVKKHVKFKAKHGYTYPLVADTEHTVCELNGE